MTFVADPTQVWIYHERQKALLCGQHALNNLAQATVFSAGRLAEIAYDLDQTELKVWAQNNEGGVNSADYLNRLKEGSANVDAQGNFSIEVLKAALMQQFGITLPHLSQQDLLAGKDITEFQGFLCHKSDHWFSIRFIADRFWNLNSILERPVVVSHFQLATEMEKWRGDGYTIFCVQTGLPEGGRKLGPGTDWHRMSDLLQGRSTQADPWESLTGSGMRLDGRHGASSNSSVSSLAIEGMTEDEQLQIALQASMEPTKPHPRHGNNAVAKVPLEPSVDATGAIRIQFRLPDGKRLVRRFLDTDSVSVVYAFVKQSSEGRSVDLLCGFPPKDLEGVYDQTIAQAKLAGESIQARYSS
jgi:Ataxin-3